MSISERDRTILRDLAKRVAEIGNLPVQKERAELWTRHNDLGKTRPLVLIFPEGSWREMLTDADLRTSPDCPLRGIEWDLRHRIYHHERLKDDNVIEPVVVCPIAIRSTGIGLAARTTRPAEATGAAHYESVLEPGDDLNKKIRMPQVTVDRDATNRSLEELNAMFGDILTVEQRGRTGLGCAPMDALAQWRGLEQIYTDLVDRPQWVHQAMSRIVDCHLSELEQCEVLNVLSLNNRNHYAGSGGNGYTRQLPQPDFDGRRVRMKDMWGFATAQMFSEVSPAMHLEFALRHEMRVLERSGLNCYGCCEPLHNKLGIVKTIPNLRRISISPWADVARCAEQLQDKYVFSWKPNPAIVAGESWDPGHVRRVIRDFCGKTRGCVTEMILKDTHTCRNEPQRLWEWVRIAREVAKEFAQY
jgi:hypothetical protein